MQFACRQNKGEREDVGKGANDGPDFENEFRAPLKHVDGDVR